MIRFKDSILLNKRKTRNARNKRNTVIPYNIKSCFLNVVKTTWDDIPTHFILTTIYEKKNGQWK